MVLYRVPVRGAAALLGVSIIGSLFIDPTRKFGEQSAALQPVTLNLQPDARDSRVPGAQSKFCPPNIARSLNMQSQAENPGTEATALAPIETRVARASSAAPLRNLDAGRGRHGGHCRRLRDHGAAAQP